MFPCDSSHTVFNLDLNSGHAPFSTAFENEVRKKKLYNHRILK